MPKNNYTPLLVLGGLVILVLFLSNGKLFTTIPLYADTTDANIQNYVGNASAVRLSYSQNRSLYFVTTTTGNYNISLNAWQQAFGTSNAQLQVYLDGTQYVINQGIPSIDNNNPNLIAFTVSDLAPGNHSLVLGFWNDFYDSGVNTATTVLTPQIPVTVTGTANANWSNSQLSVDNNIATASTYSCNAINTQAQIEYRYMLPNWNVVANNSISRKIFVTANYSSVTGAVLQTNIFNAATGTYGTGQTCTPRTGVGGLNGVLCILNNTYAVRGIDGSILVQEIASSTSSCAAPTLQLFEQNLIFEEKVQARPVGDRNLLVSNIQYNLIVPPNTTTVNQTTNTTTAANTSCKVLTCSPGYSWFAPCSCQMVCPEYSNSTAGLNCDVITGGTDWQGCSLPPRCSEYLANPAVTLAGSADTTTSTTGSILGGFTISNLLFNPVAVVAAIGIILFFAGAFKKKK